MADDTNTFSSQGRQEGGGGGRGQRPGGGRDAGGFRIRLSDNEMQAARTLQEAFNLRSTVAVLGFSLRTLAQLLEEGKLDEVVAQQRAQGQGRPAGPRQERGERRGERDRAPGARSGGRVDPFARPSRPAPAAAADGDGSEAIQEEAAPSDIAEDAAAGVAEVDTTIETEGLNADAGSEAAAES